MGNVGTTIKCPDCGKHTIFADVLGTGMRYCSNCGWLERPDDNHEHDPHAHEEGKSGG